jgi:signal peptidase
MRVASAFASLSMWLLAVAGLTVFVASTAWPAVAGLTTVRIEGNSMQPAIPYGSLVYVEPIEQPRVGDIVTFAASGRIITHRVTHDVSGNGDLWRTQGDNSPAEDAIYLTNDRIIGRTVFSLPALGIVTTLLAEPVVVGFLVSLAGLLIVAFPRPRTSADAPARPWLGLRER